MSSLERGFLIQKTNSANGVGVRHRYFNASDKVMKYITFTYVPYNDVGDQVCCTINKKVEAAGRLTGPVEPKEVGSVEWDVLWYNPTISEIQLAEVSIEYMDGSKETLIGNDIGDMDAEGSVYYETIQKPADQKKARQNELQQAYMFFTVFKCMKKMNGDEEMKFHANQGLWLLIFEIIGTICCALGPLAIVGVALWAGAIFFWNKCIVGIKEEKQYEIPLLCKIKLVK